MPNWLHNLTDDDFAYPEGWEFGEIATDEEVAALMEEDAR